MDRSGQLIWTVLNGVRTTDLTQQNPSILKFTKPNPTFLNKATIRGYTVIPRYIAVHVSRIQYIVDFPVLNVLYNVK